MRHLIISREYPPAAYPAGGIGTYVSHVARLLAERGEHVHVVGQLWEGAPDRVETRVDGRLTIHRVPLDGSPVSDGPLSSPESNVVVRDFLAQYRPALAFAWQAALLAEHLAERESIDIIEGQDYESPLYFLQLRRALGLGPASQPPCLVHLHSPLEFICRYNDWDIGRPEYLPTKRCEDYSIGAADAWLCPSVYLARQAEQHYGLPPGAVDHVPLPTGATCALERNPDVWRTGTICYVGRMEARKGVFEWVSAAVSIARDDPDVRFVFIGADTPLDRWGGHSARRALQAMVPAAFESRFVFLDAAPRDVLFERLAEARLAVVPSRWENFPNTCIEAMGSGVPVIATRNGGMAEVLDDGRSGWLANACSPVELATTLKRALATPPSTLEAMGREAVRRVAEVCDNDRVIDAHLLVRARVVRAGRVRSHTLPDSLPLATPLLLSGPRAGSGIAQRSAPPRVAPVATTPTAAAPLAAVVDCTCSPGQALATVASLRAQTRPPGRIAVLVDPVQGLDTEVMAQLGAGAIVVSATGTSGDARARALDALLMADSPAAIACVDAGCVLRPEFLDAARHALDHAPRVGVLVPWAASARHAGGLGGPCPALPYAWLSREIGGITVWRTAALCDAGGFPRDFDAGLEVWDALLGAMAKGWAAATLPMLAGHDDRPDARLRAAVGAAARVRMWPWMLARTADHLGMYAADLAVLMSARDPSRDSGVTGESDVPRLGILARIARRIAGALALARRAITHPRYAARWLVAHGRSIIRRPERTPEDSGRGMS